MSTVLLPTQGVVGELYRLANTLQVYDYDLTELLRLIFSMMGHISEYPRAFVTMSSPEEPNYLARHVPSDHRDAYVQLVRWLYDEIHHALVASSLYDPQGHLISDNFFILREDVGIHLTDVENPPSDT